MTIVIDPGHGGIDGGAPGPCGAREKDVVLAIARLLHEQLPGSVLTRDADTFIELADRARFANDAEASLFVSIHTNGHHTGAEGIETFHDPQGSAKSKELARAIQTELTKTFSDHKDRGVKTANYLVLERTSMPAVLVETEFITSRWCEWLTKPDVQKQYADAIARAVRKIARIDAPAPPPAPPRVQSIADELQDVIGRLTLIKRRLSDAGVA